MNITQSTLMASPRTVKSLSHLGMAGLYQNLLPLRIQSCFIKAMFKIIISLKDFPRQLK